MSNPQKENEEERLAALERLNILYSDPSAEFDIIVELAAQIFDCPIGLISLVAEEEQWFKAHYGLAETRTPRDISFCTRAIEDTDIFVVPDATEDERFNKSPLVTGPLGFRFYVGCPLSLDGQHNLGTLCVISDKPQSASEEQKSKLRKLADVAVSLLRSHEKTTEMVELSTEIVEQDIANKKQTALLEKIVSVSRIGGWELSLADNVLVWTSETKRIHDLDDDYEPSLEKAIEFYPADARPVIEAGVANGIKDKKGWDLELPLVTAKGREVWVRAIGEPIVEEGEVVRLIGTFQDISEQKHAEFRLRESELVAQEKSEELKVTLENMNQGVSVFDQDAKLILWNDQYIEIFGKEDGEITYGRSFRELIQAEKDRGDFDGNVDELVGGLLSQLESGKTVRSKATLKSGRMISSIHAPMPGGGWVGTHEDITEQERISNRIKEESERDTLTGLANRLKFNAELRAVTEQEFLAGEDKALALVDLDGFKQVNDTFGHAVGDELLIGVAAKLKANVRKGDLVARLGGDEFAVIFRSPSGTDYWSVETTNRLVEELNQPFDIEGNHVQIGASIGACKIEAGCNVEQLLERADSALYKIKRSGKGGARFFDAEIANEVLRRRNVEAQLRKIHFDRECHLLYQPIVCLRSNRTVGFEALIRWENDVLGSVSPAEFIPIAEEIGLAAHIGQWVLDTALRAAVNWPNHLTLSVNLSSRQLGQNRLVKQLSDLLAIRQFDPKRLELEITEHTLLQNDVATMYELSQLREHGIKVTLDDFGTGYSSLSNLLQCPFDKLKIDRTFVMNLESDPQSAAIVCAVTNLAQALNIETTAEGIETEAQLTLLRSIGCNHAQGYFLGRPSPAEKLDAFFDTPQVLKVG